MKFHNRPEKIYNETFQTLKESKLTKGHNQSHNNTGTGTINYEANKENSEKITTDLCPRCSQAK